LLGKTPLSVRTWADNLISAGLEDPGFIGLTSAATATGSDLAERKTAILIGNFEMAVYSIVRKHFKLRAKTVVGRRQVFVNCHILVFTLSFRHAFSRNPVNSTRSGCPRIVVRGRLITSGTTLLFRDD
jgi:hypothetical protein